MNKDNTELIIRYLLNDLSEQEKDAFFLWVNADGDNKKLFFEIKALYEARDLSEKEKNGPYIEESWKRLQHRRKRGKPRHLFLRKAAAYAAVALISVILTSSFFLLNTGEDSPVNTARYVGGNGIEADSFFLPDGSRIYVGPRATFYFNSDYGDAKRDIYLEGEAYFEVFPIKDKPFVVHANGIEIEALGTSFNVAAYPGDSLLVATLAEGSILIAGEYIPDRTTIKPNEQLIYNRNRKTTKIHEVESGDYTSWRNGYYYFSDQDLKSILKRMEPVYGVTFEIQSERIKKQTFTGTFYKGQSPKEILEVIKASVPIRYEIEERHISVFE